MAGSVYDNRILKNSVKKHDRFNFKISRCIIKRVLGKLKGKFSRLNFVDMSNNFVLSLCTLHNFCIDNDITSWQDDEMLIEGSISSTSCKVFCSACLRFFINNVTYCQRSFYKMYNYSTISKKNCL